MTFLPAAVLNDFENVLDASKRHMSSGMLSEIVRACLILSESDSNKPHLCSNKLLGLTTTALKLYAFDSPRLAVTRANGLLLDFGGGGSDSVCAQLCLELLLQLSFCFSNEKEWRHAVEEQCSDLNQVICLVKDLPPDRSLDAHALLSLKHLLASLYQAAPSQVASASSASVAKKKHVMLSYCWAAKKELVVELATTLKAKGVDVWRDEEGSQCVPAMIGSTGDCMASAIEHSHTIIICVSRAYKSSANCRMEANYAKGMQKRGKVQLVFVMMEQDYTTSSSPEYVDGWLGLMMGDELWHGMWAEHQVAAVAAVIDGSASPLTAAAPSASLSKRSADSYAPSAKSARTLPLDECFSYLFDTTKHTDPGAMSALLQQLGISQPFELQYLDDSQLCSIVALFKPVPAKVFAHTMSGFLAAPLC